MYLPGAIVEEAIGSAPAVVQLYNRLGEQAMALGAGPLHARTSSGATGFLDLTSGERRAPTSHDAIQAARLADALPHIHGVSTMAAQPADMPATMADVLSLRIALANTVKPLGYVCLNESLLEAGLRAGMPMPYGCSNGTCGDCKCRVVSGDVMKMRPHDYPLTEAERSEGITLACAYTAVGDVTLEVDLGGAAEIREQTIQARVREVETLGGRRIAVHLITSRAERMRYLAGQNLEITVDGQSRIVPAASCPCDERRIEVHVLCDAPANEGPGPFSSLMTNAQVSVRGPFGAFVLDDASERPVVLVAEGAGFAQIKSLLQHALSLEQAPSIALVRLANDEGLYQENLLKSYANALDDFSYVPFAQGTPHNAVIDAVVAEAGALQGCDVYAAGCEDFLDRLRARCVAEGLPDAQWKAETAE